MRQNVALCGNRLTGRRRKLLQTYFCLQVFLSKLSRPLTIPDDKITRWHPKFPLDEVPDIEESPLPQPPDVQTYQTAQDILDHARGKVMPKVCATCSPVTKQNI